MSLLNTVAKAAGTAGNVITGLPSGVAYAATGGRIGTDLTPGYSATNVVKTQAGNLIGSKPASSNTSGQGGQVLGADTSPDGKPSTNDVYTGQNGTAAGSGAGSASDAAAYTDQANQYGNLLSGLDGSLNTGLKGYDSSAQNELAKLIDQFNLGKQNLNTKRGDATADYGSANQTINRNAASGFRGLQSLLGGTGSAGDILAPFAVSQQANSQKGQSATAFSRNLRDLDTADQGLQRDNKNAQDDIINQRDNAKSTLESSIIEKKNQYIAARAAAENQARIAKGGNYATPTAANNQIAQLLQEQAGLADKYKTTPYRTTTLNTDAPDITKYQAEAAQLGGLNATEDGSTDDTSAALAAFLDRQKQQSGYSY